MTQQQSFLTSKFNRLLSVALAAMAMGVSVASHATDAQSNTGDTMGMDTAGTAVERSHDVTRAEVRESLMNARAAGLLTPNGEIGDTTEVLQRREDFYALQTEVLQAQYQAVALREQQAQEKAQEQAQAAASWEAAQIAQLVQGADSRAMSSEELNAWLAQPAQAGDVVVLVIEEK